MKFDKDKLNRILEEELAKNKEFKKEIDKGVLRIERETNVFLFDTLEKYMAFGIALGWQSNWWEAMFIRLRQDGCPDEEYAISIISDQLREAGYVIYYNGFTRKWDKEKIIDPKENLDNGGWFDDAKPPKKNKIIAWIENNWLVIIFAIACFVFCHYLFA